MNLEPQDMETKGLGYHRNPQLEDIMQSRDSGYHAILDPWDMQFLSFGIFCKSIAMILYIIQIRNI